MNILLVLLQPGGTPFVSYYLIPTASLDRYNLDKLEGQIVNCTGVDDVVSEQICDLFARCGLELGGRKSDLSAYRLEQKHRNLQAERIVTCGWAV